MKDLIELKSGGGEHHSLSRLVKKNGGESYSYMLKTSSYIIRSGYTNKGERFIDIFRGPRIIEGGYLKEADAIVKSLSHIHGLNYIVTLEANTEKDEERNICSDPANTP